MNKLMLTIGDDILTVTTEYMGPATRGIPAPVVWTDLDVGVADAVAKRLGMTVLVATSPAAGGTGPRVYRRQPTEVAF